MKSVAYVGDVAHIAFKIQNRSGKEFLVSHVEVAKGTKRHRAMFRIVGKTGVSVGNGEHQDAVAQLPSWKPGKVSLDVVGKNGDRISLRGLELP